MVEKVGGVFGFSHSFVDNLDGYKKITSNPSEHAYVCPICRITAIDSSRIADKPKRKRGRPRKEDLEREEEEEEKLRERNRTIEERKTLAVHPETEKSRVIVEWAGSRVCVPLLEKRVDAFDRGA